MGMRKRILEKDNLMLYAYAGISLAYLALFVAKYRTINKSK